MFIIDFIINDEKIFLVLYGGFEQWKIVGFYGCFRVGICLFLVELCERFIFFEVVCNMIFFCIGRFGFYNYQVVMFNLGFIGILVFIFVFMGWFADEYFGRNKLMYIVLFLYFLGECLLMIVFGGEYRDVYIFVKNFKFCFYFVFSIKYNKICYFNLFYFLYYLGCQQVCILSFLGFLIFRVL